MGKVRKYFRDKFGRFARKGGGSSGRKRTRRPLTPIGVARSPEVQAADLKRRRAEARSVEAYLRSTGGGKLSASDRKLINRVQGKSRRKR